MKTHLAKRNSVFPAVAGVLMVFGGSAQACDADSPYLSSICVMAGRVSGGANSFGMYMPANGATLAVTQYQALYALIGNIYGGSGMTSFKLPDLRGRVIIGAGQGTNPNGGLLPDTYTVGQVGGSSTVTLTVPQLPAHTHLVVSGNGGVQVTPGLGSLSATTKLDGVTATVDGSKLTLNASSNPAGTGSPSGAALASLGLSKFYVASAPAVAMAAGSISGSAPVNFGTTQPQTSLVGAPTVALNGPTTPTGGGLPVPVMPPFVAMTYYIAVNGLFPSSN